MSIGTIYKGSTGLLAFAKGLDVISNNVANLNTPGYKRSNVLFRELFYNYQLTGSNNGERTTSQLGNGVAQRGTTLSFGPGQIQESGNSTDVAISGNGLFVLRDDENTFYTRAGQFIVDEQGYLIASGSQARVMGIDEQGNLSAINVNAFRSNPPSATTEISFRGALSTSLADDASDPSAPDHVLEDVEIIDPLGNVHRVDVNFENTSTTTLFQLEVTVTNEDGDIVGGPQTIRYNRASDGSGLSGTPAVNFNTVSFTFAPENSSAFDVILNFGEPNSRSGTTFVGGTTTIEVDSSDGILPGVLVDYSFDNDGTLVASYSNEQTSDIAQLALAWMDQLQSLRQIGDGLFLAPEGVEFQIGPPAQGVMGEIIGGSIEISNVELTQEFTDLIIVQRGFQGSSQVVTVANEMLQQLLDLGKSR